MICVQQDTTTGAYVPMNPQPTDLTTCAAVLPSYGDLPSSVWNLSATDGATISAAILGVWFVAWAGKALYKTAFLMGGNE